MIHINASESLPELKEAQYGLFLLFEDWHRPYCIAFAFLGLLEMVKDGSFSDAEHIPNAVEIGLVLILHCFQPFVHSHDPLFYCFDLQLHESRNAAIETRIVQLLLHSLALLAHQPAHLSEGSFFLLIGDDMRTDQAALYFLQNAIIVLH